MKLRTKIQLFSSLFMLVLILLINTSIYYLFYRTSADSELDQLATQTNTMVEVLQANPDLPNSELLHAFLPANGMIRVFEENQEAPILFLTKQTDFRHLPGEFSSTESHSMMRTDEGIPVAVVSKPVIWEDGSVVTLQVSEHLIGLQSTMRTLFYVLVIASLIMLIPTVIAGRFLSQFLLKPIKTLTATMKENTQEGNWQKIPIDHKSGDELYEMEKTFNEMIEKLKDTFEKQEDFVSDASHELKTPISIVKSYAQLIKRRGEQHPELLEEAIDAIDSEADRMQKLVEQLLLLAKNEIDPTMTEMDFLSLCEKTITTFQGAYDREIIFRTNSDQINIYGNEDQLQQVIYILLDNALKYSEDQVHITLTEDQGQAVLKVQDFGPGISKKDQERIFDRFYRIDKARSRDTGGTGLGLPIARTIAQLHQGDLWVESEHGMGSTFILLIPIMKRY